MSKNTNLSFLTDYITADITNGRIGINNASPAVAFDVTGVAKFSTTLTVGGNLTVGNSLTYGYIYGPSNQIFGSIGANTTWLNAGTSGLRINNAADNATLAFVSNTGNVGIGTGSPVEKLEVVRTTGAGVYIKIQDTVGSNYVGTESGNLVFLNGSASEKMRITSGGNLLVGGTSTLGAGGTNLEISGGRAQLVVNSTTATASWFSVYPAGDGNTYILRNTGYSYLFGTATNQATAGFVQQMSISSNGSIGAPSGTNIYNASDVRLKKNISTTTYGLDTISALNPVKFNWVDGFEPSEDGKDMLGFVAQEVQIVIPEAVEYFGGDINLNGKVIDNPLRVNEKFIIPVLVKAIQELSAEITILKNK